MTSGGRANDVPGASFKSRAGGSKPRPPRIRVGEGGGDCFRRSQLRGRSNWQRGCSRWRRASVHSLGWERRFLPSMVSHVVGQGQRNHTDSRLGDGILREAAVIGFNIDLAIWEHGSGLAWASAGGRKIARAEGVERGGEDGAVQRSGSENAYFSCEEMIA